jgi:DNA-binding NtrC family response regulator
MPKILIADDEENIRKVLKGLLAKNGYTNVLQAPDGLKALEIFQDENIDLIISDVNMPVMDGLEFFLKVKDSGVPFIVLTAYGTIETAVNAVKSGVYDFLPKPFDEKNLVDTVKMALKESGCNGPAAVSDTIEEIFFSSSHPEILRIKNILSRVINTRAGILISGETGTGKGVLAGIIHSLGVDKTSPFIKVNCAAIPSGLIESELFGYVKGAFTGAAIDKPGKFEMADTGTIFLDEIGELSIETQAKLLSVIQDKELTRLGDVKVRKTDVRIIAATNMDIKAAIDAKKFREDLYYRLNIVEFTLPPLRERAFDIPDLQKYFAEKYSAEFGTPKKEFDEGALSRLKSYAWPGNVRELENIVQKISIMEKESAVTADTLGLYLKSRAAGAGSSMFEAGREEKSRMEITLIKDALSRTQSNKTKASELLGISRRTLLYRLKEYGME